MGVRIVTDSTADIPPAVAAALAITVVPLTVHFGERAYRDGVDMDGDAFFQTLTTTKDLPRTSQPAPAAFLEVYDRLLAEGHEVVSVHVSATLSGTHNSAVLGRQDCAAPDRVTVVDSRSTSMCMGMAVMAGASAAAAGDDATSVLAAVDGVLRRVDLMLFVDTLEYLQRGGRIGAAKAFLGGLLSVKPLIALRNGEVVAVGQVRTRSRAIDRLRQWVFDEHSSIEGFTVLHTACAADAQALFDEVHARYPHAEAYLTQVGAVVGTHVGPGAIGVSLYG